MWYSNDLWKMVRMKSQNSTTFDTLPVVKAAMVRVETAHGGGRVKAKAETYILQRFARDGDRYSLLEIPEERDNLGWRNLAIFRGVRGKAEFLATYVPTFRIPTAQG